MKNVTYINAGAGSGKTYTLTRILSEQLSGQDSKGNPITMVKPSQVILTTFTDLAASEFREKARQKVLEAGNLDAAAQIDSAYIGTVHSVALRFIKKFWYLLGYGADIQTISERDEDFYMSQSLARIVSERDEHGVLKKTAELEAFRRFRDYFDMLDGYNHPDYLFWQRHLKDVVEKMEYYNVNDVEESIKRNLETARTIYSGEETTKEKFDALMAFLRSYYDYISDKTTGAAQEQKALIKPLLAHCEDAHELLVLVSGMKSPVGGGNKIEANCPGYTQFMADLQLLSVTSSALKIVEPYIEAIFTLAKEWRDDYVAYKEAKHIVSYNDMERLFLHLITNEREVQDYVRDNFRLVMVDEFQDSNPVQLKIFNRLSELISQSGGHSYWVGDPKQAIYGFRGADTELVNSVSKHFRFYDDAEIHPEEGERHLGSGRLVESWRSRATLVNLVNHVFADKFQHTDDKGNVVHDIDPLCITLEPHFKDDDLEDSALVHWHNEKQGAQQKVKADALAWKVKELLASGMLVHRYTRDQAPQSLRPKDVAILCRKNETIKDIVKSMRKYRIPVSESETAIMQRIEVQLVVSLLQFIQNPTNKHVIADLMRLLWGSTTEEILRDRIDYVFAKDEEGRYKRLDELGKMTADSWKEDLEQVRELVKLTERFKHMSIPEMVRGLIYECNLPALANRWGDSRIRQQNLSTVQHLADDYDQMCLQMGLSTSISGFIYYLNSVEPDMEKDNQSDTVKVYTYHGSKGLEWPVVILNELNEDTLNSGNLIKKTFMRVREVVLSDHATEEDPFAKEYYLHFFPNIIKGVNGQPSDPMKDIITEMDFYKQLEQRTRDEEKRLLYVGMTRAKDYLFTTGVSDDFSWLKNIGIFDSTKDSVWGSEGFPTVRQDISVPNQGEVQIEEQRYTHVYKPSVHNEYGDRYLSPSKIDDFPGYSRHKEWNERGTAIDTRGWGTDYATIGTCIHDFFAAYKKGRDEDNRKSAVSIIGGYGLAEQLSGHIDAIICSADWLYDTLQRHYPQTSGDRIEREVPFMMTLSDGRILRGEIDLLWHYTDADGVKRCVLIDYKSFRGVALHEHTKTHYAQLSAYAKALSDSGIEVSHTLVYYPVHAVIHELE